MTPTSIPDNSTPTATHTPTPTPSATPTDSPVSTVLEPDVETKLSYAVASGGRIGIAVPAGAVDKPVTLYFDAQNLRAAQTKSVTMAKRSFQLTVYQESLALYDYHFQESLEITIEYTDKEISGLNEARLMVLAYDVTTDSWTDQGITLVEHDMAANRLVVNTTTPALYALGTASEQIFLPLVLR
jgi:hypothetical protein